MGQTLAETIKEATRWHLLENNGLLLAQCVRAVGWIGGTVPELTEQEGIIELPICDVAGGGFACGVALSGRRPIFIVRYQGFMWYDCASLINYAAKSKGIWNVPCPVFIRSIAMEGKGIGPVASSSQHGMFMRPPGCLVVAPMTPGEWTEAWLWYHMHDDPMYVSEHRMSFNIDYEMPNRIRPDSKITILAISSARLSAIKAIEVLDSMDIPCDLIHVTWLKPFNILSVMEESLAKTKLGVVFDSDFSISGPSRSIAYELMHITGAKVHAVGLEDRTCGVATAKENCVISKDGIISTVKNLLGE
jgi:acetoin:2,6-dichlorophenolindophenol oxidoreductase subunit beta